MTKFLQTEVLQTFFLSKILFIFSKYTVKTNIFDIVLNFQWKLMKMGFREHVNLGHTMQCTATRFYLLSKLALVNSATLMTLPKKNRQNPPFFSFSFLFFYNISIKLPKTKNTNIQSIWSNF